MITYKEVTNANREITEVGVYLDNKRVGEIVPSEKGWRYYPKGSLNGGDWFKTIAAVKRSIESQ